MMMHPALWKLMWMDWRSSIRRLFWVRRTWRQWIVFAFLVIFVVFFAGSQLISGWARESAGEMPQATRFGLGMPFWALLYLLASWLTAAADRGLVMRPAEIHFLVSGPFSAAELINMNVLRLAIRSLASALILTVMGLAYIHSFPSALVGIWLLLLTSMLVGMLVSLAARKSVPAIVVWIRRILTPIAIAVLIGLVVQAIAILDREKAHLIFSEIAAKSSNTSIGQWVLPPVAWMFAPLRAEEFWPQVPWQLCARLPILLLMVLGIHAIGGSFGEAATDRTDRAIQRRQAALRSGVVSSSGLFRNLSIPKFARLGGIGSVAWVEAVQSMRMLPRFVLYTTTVVGIILVVPIVMDRHRLQGTSGMAWMAGLTAYADFLLLLQLPVGFLGPVAQREIFKLLPIPSWRIVAGKLAGPVLPLLVNHGLTFILFMVILPGQRWQIAQTAAAMIPAAIALAAIVNLLGIWNVIRPRALQQRDALAAGRAMLSIWLFTTMTVPVTIMAVLCGTLLSWLLGNQLWVYLLGGCAGICICICVLTWLLTRAFDRWQPQSGEAREEELELNR